MSKIKENAEILNGYKLIYNLLSRSDNNEIICAALDDVLKHMEKNNESHYLDKYSKNVIKQLKDYIYYELD